MEGKSAIIMSESSIFRKKRIYIKEKITNNSKNNFAQNKVTHDNGILRAREYSLSSVLYFTEHSGISIKELIQIDFNYFTWLSRNIEGFTYTKEVLEYAHKCLLFLEKLELPPKLLEPKLNYALEQVSIMLDYEHTLDFDDNPNLLDVYKSMINVKFYKSIDQTTIRFIRQSLNIDQLSTEYRRLHFKEINKKIINFNSPQENKGL